MNIRSMSMPTEYLSDRVSLILRPTYTSNDLDSLLEKEGFKRLSGKDPVASLEQHSIHKPTSTDMTRVIYENGNGRYKGFVRIEGTTVTQVRNMDDLGETPDERINTYRAKRLEEFIGQFLKNYFIISERRS